MTTLVPVSREMGGEAGKTHCDECNEQQEERSDNLGLEILLLQGLLQRDRDLVNIPKSCDLNLSAPRDLSLSLFHGPIGEPASHLQARACCAIVEVQECQGLLRSACADPACVAIGRGVGRSGI